MHTLLRWFLVAVACSSTALAQQPPLILSISTGGTAGVWYPMGGAMANILSKNLPGAAVTAEVTGGSVDNIRLLASGRTHVGFSMVDAAWEGINGAGKFKDKVPMRTLAVVHPLVMHAVTLEGRGIEKMTDLKGKRVSTGPPGSGTEIMALRILEFYGLDIDKDIVRARLSVGEAANAMKDGKLDAFLHAAGVPLPAVTDLGATPRARLKLIDHADSVDGMNRKYGPIYARGKVAAKSYPGQERDNTTANVWGVLYVHEKMSDKVAYDVVKTLFDRQPEIVMAHREAENMTLENQSIGASPVPWHPGAVRYFKEKGIAAR
jgi:uncharacterized protein